MPETLQSKPDTAQEYTKPFSNDLTPFEKEVLRLIRSEPRVGISPEGVWNSTVSWGRSVNDVIQALYKLENMGLAKIKPMTSPSVLYLDSSPTRRYLPVETDPAAADRLAELAAVAGGSSLDPGDEFDTEPFQTR
jgi:hypothetical protein